MKRTIRPASLAAVVAFLAAACTTTWKPVYDLESVTLADGTQAWRVQCPGNPKDTAACFDQMKRLCEIRGYRMIDPVGGSNSTGKDPTVITFACNQRPQAAPPSPPPVQAPVQRKIYTVGADVLFAFGKSTLAYLNPAGREALDRIARETVEGGADELAIDVRGYTDRIGSESANLALSRARAQTVANYLSMRGLPRSVMSTAGLGEDEPVTTGCPAGNGDAAIACLAPDRRVTIEVRRWVLVN